MFVETAFCQQVAGEEWGENEKDWVEKAGEKKMAAVSSYDRAHGSRQAFCVFLPRKSNLVDYLGYSVEV